MMASGSAVGRLFQQVLQLRGGLLTHCSSARSQITLSRPLHGRFGPPASQLVEPAILEVTKATPKADVVKFGETSGDQRRNPFNPDLLPEEIRYDEDMEELSPAERRLSQEILTTVNTAITEESHGRLFGVIYMNGKQWRVTEGDIMMLKGTYHLALGQKVNIEKVLAVGSADFTLIGRPLLDRDMVSVDATCIEKTQSYPIIYLRHLKQIPLRKYRFERIAQTMVRINRISIVRRLNHAVDPQKMLHNVF